MSLIIGLSLILDNLPEAWECNEATALGILFATSFAAYLRNEILRAIAEYNVVAIITVNTSQTVPIVIETGEKFNIPVLLTVATADALSLWINCELATLGRPVNNTNAAFNLFLNFLPLGRIWKFACADQGLGVDNFQKTALAVEL